MAIKTYKKGTAVTLSTNFKSTEFDCHGSGCCSSTKVDEKLVEYLQKIRDHFGKSVNINSGYRCKTHNASVGGASQSNHMDGEAADIRINGVTPLEVAQYAEHIGVLGIGVYSWGVHIDTRTSKYFWYDGGASNVKTFGGTFKEEEKKEEKPVETVTKEMYRVRKSWADAKSQIGAYTVLQNAKNACNKAGTGYYVFNSKGEVVFPTIILEVPKEEVKPDVSMANTSAADPKKMWDYFKSQGLNDYGVAGLMGNLYAESGLRACNLQNTYEKSLGMSDAEYTAAVDAGTYTNFVNDKAGYGLAQWTYWSLKQDMLNYFKKKNKSIGDLETQMEFLTYQLSNSYKAVWNTLKTAATVLEASNAVLLKFERPADQSVTAQNKRASYGQKYFDAYGTKAAPAPESPKPSVPTEGGNGKMKYSASNKPLVCMQTQSTCYKGTSNMTVKGVLWHSTGANNPNLKRYVQPSDTKPAADTYNKDEWLKLLGTNTNKNDWNHITRQAGLNCWIGKLADGTVTTVQTMPWNYKPWGCGSGSKGSCNNGWIQFEICEDGLTDKNYFNKVYKEACEITAYLCDMYNIDPHGTVTVNGVQVPTILCHADSHSLGLGSNHGDINHWFPKHGKSMKTVRDDVAELMGKNASSVITPVAPEKEMYRVRKAWEDAKSQIGAYTNLDNAKKACDKAGEGYEVYNASGVAVYPQSVIVEDSETVSTDLKIGDAVKLISGATYTSGKAIPNWVFRTKLYVRDIRKNGDVVISTQKTGASTGVVSAKYLTEYATATNTPVSPTFAPYLVRINTDILNVRAGAGTGYKITTQVLNNEVYTIVAENGKWGKLKSGAGWIHLDYTKKI